MKLYNKYKKLVSKLGDIKTAWFTSFNLSPFFIETYIIPPLVGSDTKPIRQDEFEIIQQKINESKIDIRFFCDRRYIEMSETKKTCVPFHLVDINKIKGAFKGGVCHAKVILLINKKNDAFLITGSANLTLSGWAHNRECIIIKEIRDNKNKLEVITFFKALFKANNEKFPKIEINTTKDNDNWNFVSSFSKTPFLESLFPDEEQNNKCIIFSPYFSNNLKGLLDNHILTQVNDCMIVPDITSNNKIRMEKKSNNIEIIENKKLKFGIMNYTDKNDSKIQMTHAKVWITDNRIALGSWNLTEAALNVADNQKNNIEAGIIYENENSDKIIKDIKPLKIETLFMTQEELQDEEDNKVNNINFDITVRFDWEIQKYFIDISKELDQENYILLLPDCEKFQIIQKNYEKEVNKIDKLLFNKIFNIMKNKTFLYSGIILEQNSKFRPVWKYNNMNDLFYSFIQNKFNESSDKLVLRALSNLTELLIDDNKNIIETKNNNLTYFDLFKAFKNISNKIDNIFKLKKNKLVELNYLLRVYPNSLFALNENIQEFIKDKSEEDVLKWILSKEYNELLMHILTQFELNSDLEKYLKNLIFPTIDKISKINKSWLKFIDKEYYTKIKMQDISNE